MEASKIIANRAYRIIRELKVNAPHKPSIGDVVYCFEAGRYLAFAFCHPDSAGIERDYQLKVPRSDVEGVMVFSKLVTLPPSLKRRYNIREDGTRFSFSRDAIYVLANPVEGAPAPGTLFRCIKGGRQPMLIHWAAGATDPIASNATGQLRQQLYPADAELIDTSHDEFSMTATSASVEWNWATWRVRMDNEVLSWREHQLSLSRPATGRMRVNELKTGSLKAIANALWAHLNEHGINLKASDAELIELYANHEYHFKGLRPFAGTVELIKRYVDEDTQRTEYSASQRKAAAAQPISGGESSSRKRMSSAAYKNMMYSQARSKVTHY